MQKVRNVFIQNIKLDKGTFTIDDQTQTYNKGKIDFYLDTLGGNFDGSGFYFNYSTE